MTSPSPLCRILTDVRALVSLFDESALDAQGTSLGRSLQIDLIMKSIAQITLCAALLAVPWLTLGQETPADVYPDGTTAILIDGAWQLSPPSVAFQEERLLQVEEEEGSKLGRLYHIRHLMTGVQAQRGTLANLQEALARAAELNRQENTAHYYVFVGTRY